jgi:hypothetical protein
MVHLVRHCAATFAIASLFVAQPSLAARSEGPVSVAESSASSPPSERTGSSFGDAENLKGNERFIIPAVVIVAAVAIVLALTNGHHDGNANSHPASP